MVQTKDLSTPIDVYSISPIELIGSYGSCADADRELCGVIKTKWGRDIFNCLSGRVKFFKDREGTLLIAMEKGTTIDKVQRIISQRRINGKHKRKLSPSYYAPKLVSDNSVNSKRIERIKRAKNGGVEQKSYFESGLDMIVGILTESNKSMLGREMNIEIRKVKPDFNLSNFVYYNMEKINKDGRFAVSKNEGNMNLFELI